MEDIEAGPEQASQTHYDNIIPTGWLTAYGRTFTDIPYAREVFQAIDDMRGEGDSAAVMAVMKDTGLAPQFEARHKLLNRLINTTGIKQVLEVAAGLSTRGMEMTEDPNVTYVETDLPAMTTDKRHIVQALEEQGTLPHRPNLFIEPGSAVTRDDMLTLGRCFDPDKPLVVMNEGLLRYLTFEEKAAYAENVKALLQQFGGVWITSDISLPQVVYKEEDVMADRRKKISEVTGINVADNLFVDEAEARNYFEKFGFEVESHSFLEVLNELTSPSALNMDPEYVRAINESAVCFVMRLDEQEAA
ncbi:MAG TPA: class I SAM-dependent methyltransferase [Patescibacteria group bacterium]|nr:class I SAM-dependent methyltransferase [Patescibacteria group bacterium]